MLQFESKKNSSLFSKKSKYILHVLLNDIFIKLIVNTWVTVQIKFIFIHLFMSHVASLEPLNLKLLFLYQSIYIVSISFQLSDLTYLFVIILIPPVSCIPFQLYVTSSMQQSYNTCMIMAFLLTQRAFIQAGCALSIKCGRRSDIVSAISFWK